MDPFADIDLDAAAIWVDGAWCTREDLARRIKQMVDAGDYRVSRFSEALERLEAVLARTEILTARVPSDLAAALGAACRHAGRPMGHLLREAVAYYLAAAAAAQAAAPRPAPSEAVDVEVPDDPRSAEESFFGKKMG